MFDEKAIEEIKNWFKKVKEFEFMVPGQYSTRRGDSIYIIENIYENEGNLTIEMDEKRKFIISGDFRCRFVDDNLEIDKFDWLIFEWDDDGYGQRFDGRTNVGPQQKVYDEGILLFMPALNPFNPDCKP